MEMTQKLTHRVPPFKVGHSRSLEPTRIDRLSTISSYVYRTVSQIKGDICKKIPTPCI